MAQKVTFALAKSKFMLSSAFSVLFFSLAAGSQFHAEISATGSHSVFTSLDESAHSRAARVIDDGSMTRDAGEQAVDPLCAHPKVECQIPDLPLLQNWVLATRVVALPQGGGGGVSLGSGSFSDVFKPICFCKQSSILLHVSTSTRLTRVCSVPDSKYAVFCMILQMSVKYPEAINLFS